MSVSLPAPSLYRSGSGEGRVQGSSAVGGGVKGVLAASQHSIDGVNFLSVAKS